MIAFFHTGLLVILPTPSIYAWFQFSTIKNDGDSTGTPLRKIVLPGPNDKKNEYPQPKLVNNFCTISQLLYHEYKSIAELKRINLSKGINKSMSIRHTGMYDSISDTSTLVILVLSLYGVTLSFPLCSWLRP